MKSETRAGEEHPILVRDIVHRDGSRSLSLRVFCTRQERSVPLDVCEACPSCTDIVADGDAPRGLVRCAPICVDTAPSTFERSVSLESIHAASSTPVGEILREPTTCVDADVTTAALRALFVEHNLSGALVVDDEGRLLGFVRDLDLLRAFAEHVSTAETSSSSSPFVVESATVHEAILRMASSHAREIPVVTRDGVLLGVLRDIDGLRWLAQHRGARR